MNGSPIFPIDDRPSNGVVADKLGLGLLAALGELGVPLLKYLCNSIKK
jgi:hypothetical protein